MFNVLIGKYTFAIFMKNARTEIKIRYALKILFKFTNFVR